MKLNELITLLNRPEAKRSLPNNYTPDSYDRINVYAAYSVSVDADFYLFENSGRDEKYFVNDKISYEKLCSLSELARLVSYFSHMYPKAPNKILRIHIVDYLQSHL